MDRQALVTGAEGFAGTALCARLAGAGYAVKGCDISVPAGREDRLACNIADAHAVQQLLEWAQPVTHIFHLAAVDFVPAAKQDPSRVMTVNLNGTIHLIRAMKRYAPGARLLFVGSAESYGFPRALPITEEHSLDPVTPYAISKTAADLYCRFSNDASGLDVVRIRPFNHSGPGQSSRFVLPSIARQVASIEAGRQESVLRAGNLDAARDFTHVNDVAEAYLRAAEGGRPGEAYNVCSGVSRRIGEIVEMFTGLSSAEIRVEVEPDLMRGVDVPELRGSHAKLTRDTGWEPSVTLEGLVAEQLAHWRERIAALG